MMRFLRSQSQSVLVFVLAVIGIGFLFYGNSGNLLTNSTPHQSNDYGRIDGTDITYAQLIDAVKTTRYAIIIGGQGRLLNQPGAREQLANEAWNRLLLLAEADRLHITVSNQQLEDQIRSMDIFQDPQTHAFSYAVYQQRMAQLQPILGARLDSTGIDPLVPTKLAFETVTRNNLRISAVSAALFGTVRSPAKNIAAEYDKIYGPATVSVVTFDPQSYAAAVQVTPAEIEAAYKAQPMNPAFRTKEKRRVEYVLYSLTPEQAKLSATEKKVAKNALGEKALEFALTFQPDPIAKPGVKPPPPPDFTAEAKKRGLTPVVTEFFTEETMPASVPPSPAFQQAAFALTKDDIVSKVVEMENGVALMRLVEIQPSELLPLDKVKDGIIQQIKQEKGAQAAETAAAKAATDLQAAVAKGTDFKAAAAALKLKVETPPAFVPFNVPQEDMRLATLAYASTTLTKGQVSSAVPSPAGGSLVICLDNRAPADPAGLAAFETRYRASQDGQLRGMVYFDWANWKSKQPGTHRPPDLLDFGNAE